MSEARIDQLERQKSRAETVYKNTIANLDNQIQMITRLHHQFCEIQDKPLTERELANLTHYVENCIASPGTITSERDKLLIRFFLSTRN